MNKVITLATLMILAICQSVLSQTGELTLIGTGGAMEKSSSVRLIKYNTY